MSAFFLAIPKCSTMKYVYDGVELNATLPVRKDENREGTVHRNRRSTEQTSAVVEETFFHDDVSVDQGLNVHRYYPPSS